MSMIVPALIGLIVAGGSFTYVFDKSNLDTKESVRTLQTTKSIDIVNSGLYLMETELNLDSDWNDTLGINIDSNLKDQNGYYSLNSTEMNKLVKDYPILGGTLNIYIKPIDKNNINVISKGTVSNNNTFIALKISRNTNYNNFIPLMYGGKSASYTNTTLCTYVQNSSDYSLMGTTNANLSLYTDGTSSFSGLSLNEGTTMSSGSNAIERDLKLFGNTRGKTTDSIDINGNSLSYDTVYSTGSVGLYNGATVNEVISNKQVTTDYNTCMSKYDETYCGSESTYTNGFEFIGNVFSEDINSTNRTYCNVVDSNSNQLVSNNTNNDNFLSVVSNDSGQSIKDINNVSKVLMKEVCSNINDCAIKLQ